MTTTINRVSLNSSDQSKLILEFDSGLSSQLSYGGGSINPLDFKVFTASDTAGLATGTAISASGATFTGVVGNVTNEIMLSLASPITSGQAVKVQYDNSFNGTDAGLMTPAFNAKTAGSSGAYSEQSFNSAGFVSHANGVELKLNGDLSTDGAIAGGSGNVLLSYEKATGAVTSGTATAVTADAANDSLIISTNHPTDFSFGDLITVGYQSAAAATNLTLVGGATVTSVVQNKYPAGGTGSVS